MSPARIMAVASAVALAACGGLESPDLGSGTVSGRLVNASAGAYVYPRGRPDLKVSNEAGATSWRFTVERVPVGTAALVVVDRPTGDLPRAQLLSVDVAGGQQNGAPDVDAAAMPLAGRVAATAHLEGGAMPAALRFTVEETDQVGVPANTTGAAELEPLPPGTFDLAAEMNGFRRGRATITVVSGTTPHVVWLEIDDADEAPGCAGAGDSCRNGLRCSQEDGACYECLENDDCSRGPGPGDDRFCDPILHLCKQIGTPGDVCAACTADSECVEGVCVLAGPATGYCSRGCAGGCPAGFECDGQSDRCVAMGGCSTYLAAFGSECLSDDVCQAELKDGVCEDAYPDYPSPEAGYCTARCDSVDDCIVPGFACDTDKQLCLKP